MGTAALISSFGTWPTPPEIANETFLLFLFCLGAIPSNTQGLLLALHLNITLGSTGRPFWILGIEPGCKISNLPTSSTIYPDLIKKFLQTVSEHEN